MLRLLSSLFCLGFITISLQSQVHHWESVVMEGDAVRYKVPESQLDISWRNQDYDDDSWQLGILGLGYGDGDDQTVIDPSMSVFLRIAFEIQEISEIEEVVLDMDFDDGFIAYLNGSEIARASLSGSDPDFNQGSDELHEALLYQGIDPDRFEVDQELLVQGENLLSIQVHNDNLNSSDLTALPFLSLGINNESGRYREVPEWFDAPNVVVPVDFPGTHLPIVYLETAAGQDIPDEPKVDASMKIINRGDNQVNVLADSSDPAYLDYSGTIGIEIRGSTSACCWPKKQYSLTTYDSLGAKENVSLLGMPSENDWILFAMAFDPSLIRDFTTYSLTRAIGNYAARGKYCEVFLNGAYQGLYILQERLKADNDRIDINKIEVGDLEGKKLSGGYITKSDKEEGGEVAAWYMDNYAGWQTAFIHAHPKPDEIHPLQDEYIQNTFFSLEQTAAAHNASFLDGYPAIIDVHSFIDFMIINELTSNPDAYQFSTYFHKDRNGKLRAGPVWDFNLTYGNDLFIFGFDRSLTDVWQFDDNENVGAKFWRDLFEDPDFNCHFSRRWVELTQPEAPLHLDEMHAFIDSLVIEISDPIEREYFRWNTDGNHASHISEMKDWIAARHEWMNTQLGDGMGCREIEVPNLVISKIHYHPSTPTGEGQKDLEFIEITNAGEESVDLTGVYFGGTGLVYQFPNNATLLAGKSVFLANESDVFREYYGFNAYDEFSRSLNNGGQNITLRNGFGVTIDEVNYSDESPWPQEADGQGYFLNLIDLELDNRLATNWEVQNQNELTVANLGYSQSTLTMYPNPVTEQLTITSERRIETVRLIALSGEILKVKSIGTSQIQLDLSSIKPGLYFIEIRAEGMHYTRKIIIQ